MLLFLIHVQFEVFSIISTCFARWGSFLLSFLKKKNISNNMDSMYEKAEGFIRGFKELYNNEDSEGRKSAALLVYVTLKYGEQEAELEALRNRISELENN